MKETIKKVKNISPRKLIRSLLEKIRSSKVSYIMVIVTLTKLFGFIKLRFIAGLFGASNELDLFWAAFTIPDMMYNVLISGSINAAIIPIFSEVFHKKGNKNLIRLFINFDIVIGFIFIVFGILMFAFARPLSLMLLEGKILNITPGVARTYNPADLDLLVRWTRIMILSPVILGFSTILTAYMRVRREFFITNLAPLLYNIIILAFTYVGVKFLNMGYDGLAIAVLLGTTAQLIIQLPKFFKLAKNDFPRLAEISVSSSKELSLIHI